MPSDFINVNTTPRIINTMSSDDAYRNCELEKYIEVVNRMIKIWYLI